MFTSWSRWEAKRQNGASVLAAASECIRRRGADSPIALVLVFARILAGMRGSDIPIVQPVAT